MELINKNELHNILLFMESMEDLSYGKKIYGKVIQQVVKMPTIEAEPKHGHWIKVDKNTVKCSECGNYLDMRGVNAGRGDANYCPNCGAIMNEVENGTD